MSRSGYVDDCDDNWQLVRWRGAVASAIRGKRGQALLREALEALDAMPEKRLIPHEFEQAGAFCTLGAVAARRGMDATALDPDDPEQVAKSLGISDALAREVMFMNDEGVEEWRGITPEARWQKMRDWIAKKIEPPAGREVTQ